MKDIQNTQDKRGIDIQKVGVKDVEIPLKIQRKHNSDCTVWAKATASVSLPQNYKGTHMSRFIEVLTDWSNKNMLGVDIKSCLQEIVEKLNAKNGELEFEFKYFINKPSPVSKLVSPVCYDCSFTGTYYNNEYKFYLGVKVPVTTLCPCSKEISENGAHNQRSIVSLKINYDDDAHIWIEDLVKDIENCASSEIYSLLKREDEKFVTEQAYNNPKFVEDILRDVIIKIKEKPEIRSFELLCESFESIHNHSAWAYQKEIIPK